MGEAKNAAGRWRPYRRKKEEFSGFTLNMLPENSFPQICVVSVNESVEISRFRQDYVRSVDLSNRVY
jgi:hypothetical protein